MIIFYDNKLLIGFEKKTKKIYIYNYKGFFQCFAFLTEFFSNKNQIKLKLKLKFFKFQIKSSNKKWYRQ